MGAVSLRRGTLFDAVMILAQAQLSANHRYRVIQVLSTFDGKKPDELAACKTLAKKTTEPYPRSNRLPTAPPPPGKIRQILHIAASLQAQRAG